ncbi:MAG TPA: GFA family protein [Candidatus Binatia bacterium]|nr:GFA family protein [Candidatus Binatia bacterium]
MSEARPHAVRLGGCQCGAIRYELAGDLVAVYVCHCRECRKQSSSAFGISAAAMRSAFRVTRGTPRMWSRPTDSGNTLQCFFCGDCGSRLWHQRRGADAVISIKGGSLDDAVDLSGATHIWTSRMLPGIVLPEGCARFEGEPE